MSDNGGVSDQRLPVTQKVAYGFGSLANNLLSAASGSMMIVLNLAYGMNPALVGLLGAIPRLTDAITDPIMGYISDNTHSRWGRRRPYIFGGIIAAGVVFVVLWQLPSGANEGQLFTYFLLVSFVFFLAYTVFATPWVALGYELTPDYSERAILMGVQNFIGQAAYLVAPWFLWFMSLEFFNDLQTGASTLSVIVAIVCIALGVVPALALRERFASAPEGTRVIESIGRRAIDEIRQFGQGFVTTVVNRDFLILCGITFLIFNGFQMIASFQAYVIIYYLYAGDIAASTELQGLFGTISSISTFGVIALTTWLTTRLGKRTTFFICSSISAFGFASKWFFYSPEWPELLLISAPLVAFGLGSLFTLMGSMIADVCDVDELKTGERREGMYGSVFWWVVKLGMAMAVALGGILLNITGFDVELAGAQSEQTLLYLRILDVVVPTFSTLLAIGLMRFYTITETRAHEVRTALEERRGAI